MKFFTLYSVNCNNNRYRYCIVCIIVVLYYYILRCFASEFSYKPILNVLNQSLNEC